MRVIWNQGPTDGRPLCWDKCGDESAVDRCITAIPTGGLVAGLGLALSKPLNQRAAFLNLVVGWNFEERAGLFAAIDPCKAIAGLTHSRVAVLDITTTCSSGENQLSETTWIGSSLPT